MMPFDFRSARSLGEALDLLAQHRGRAVPVAGGTNLIIDHCLGRKRPDLVVDISRLPLRYVRRNEGRVRIGALVTVTQLLTDPVAAEWGGVLVDCARQFAGPLIRNRATVAGNIADANPAADLVVPLIALDATATVVSRERGERRVPVAEVAVGPRRTCLEPDELITEIDFPAPGAGEYGVYFKFANRRAMAISVVSGAVVLDMEGTVCREARIALGAVAPRPVRAAHAEAVLRGNRLDPGLAREAAAQVARDISPITDVRASAEYRSWVAEALVRRSILQAAGVPGEGAA